MYRLRRFAVYIDPYRFRLRQCPRFFRSWFAYLRRLLKRFSFRSQIPCSYVVHHCVSFFHQYPVSPCVIGFLYLWHSGVASSSTAQIIHSQRALHLPSSLTSCFPPSLNQSLYYFLRHRWLCSLPRQMLNASTGYLVLLFGKLRKNFPSLLYTYTRTYFRFPIFFP